jgi:Protein of unknown function (DUF3618)
VAERNADDIQAEIERARASLAQTVDQITYRTNPKRLAHDVLATLKQRANTPQGRAVIAGASAFVLIIVVHRVRKN